MKPQKLKSGNWNVRVYLGKDENGKSIIRSVTAPTRKAVIEEAVSLSHKAKGKNLNVREAVDAFIDARESVLSPHTVRGYHSVYKHHIENDGIGVVPLDMLTDGHVQKWVSRLVQAGLSPKSVRNAYGLFSAAMLYHNRRLVFNVRFPQRQRPKLHTPTTEEVMAVAEAARQTNYELYKAILLGAVGMMRRGEICALTAEDLDFKRNTISVTKALALTEDNEIVVKPPKNESSNRTVIMPKSVMDKLPHEGKVVDMTPNAVTIAFRKLLKKECLPSFRFHDLRHYAASIAASSSVGASVESIKARGGWATDGMMKRVYINQLGDEVDKDTQAITKYYDENFHQ